MYVVYMHQKIKQEVVLWSGLWNWDCWV